MALRVAGGLIDAACTSRRDGWATLKKLLPLLLLQWISCFRTEQKPFFSKAAPGASEAEVANLELAGRGQQQVGRFEVPVQHICGVHVLQAPQHLRS